MSAKQLAGTPDALSRPDSYTFTIAVTEHVRSMETWRVKEAAGLGYTDANGPQHFVADAGGVCR